MTYSILLLNITGGLTMPNINNSNNVFSDNNLDLARVYGLEDSIDTSTQNLESLTGYNLNQLEPTNNMQNNMSGNQDTGRNNVNPSNNNADMNNNTMRQPNNNENLNNSADNMPSNENVNNNMMDQSTNNENIMGNNTNNNMMGQSQGIAMPQRQEQSFPTTRVPQPNNMQISNQENLLQFQSMGNMNSFLRTQIGKSVSVQFLVGTNTLVEKSGTLLGVGSNYIVLKENGSGDILVCDFDNIKFVRFEENNM